MIDGYLVHSFHFSSCSSDKSQLRWARHHLETDVCVAGHQAADPEVIQSYVKKVSSKGRRVKSAIHIFFTVTIKNNLMMTFVV